MGQEKEQPRRKRTSKRTVAILVLVLILAVVLAFDGWMYARVKDRTDELLRRAEEAEDQVRNLEMVNGTLEAENEELFSELNDARKNREQTSVEAEELQQKLKERTEEAEALQEQVEKLQNELDEAKATLEELRKSEEPAE